MDNIEFLAEIVLSFLQIYYYIIFGRIIMSWFMMGGGGGNPALITIYQFLYSVTEPLLVPLRSVLPSIKMGMGYLDLSPIVLLILVSIVRQIIYRYVFII